MPQKSIPIQVVTWNVARRDAEVLDALNKASKRVGNFGLVTLQEVAFGEHEAFQRFLERKGLKWSHYSGRNVSRKRYGNLIASRWPFRVLEPRHSSQRPPWPQLIAQAEVSVDGRSFVLITAHIPNGANNGWKKIDTLVALRNIVRRMNSVPVILTGDFNEPRYTPCVDGHVVTWGQEWDGRKGTHVYWKRWTFKGRTGKGKKWDNSVRWVFEGDDGLGLRHAYWEVHGHGAMAVSHVVRGDPRWFDHIFVSAGFRVKECEYLHELRLQGYSDHSALSANLVFDAHLGRSEG